MGLVAVPFAAHKGAFVEALDAIAADNAAAGRPCPDLSAYLADMRERAEGAADMDALGGLIAEAAPLTDDVWTVRPMLTDTIWTVSVPQCAAAMASIRKRDDGFAIVPTPQGVRRYPAFGGPAGLKMGGLRDLGAVLDWLQTFLGAVDFVTYDASGAVIEDTRGAHAPPVVMATAADYASRHGF